MARGPRIAEEQLEKASGGGQEEEEDEEEEQGALTRRRLLRRRVDDDNDDFYDETSGSESGDGSFVEAWCIASAAIRDEHNHVSNHVSKYYQKHASFYDNFRLAIVVGLFISLAGMPVYAVNIHYKVFGLRGELANLTTWVQKTQSRYDNETNQTITWDELELRTQTWEQGCGPMALSKMRNVAPYGEEPQIVRWNSSMPPWDRSNPRDIWCGFLPDRYSLLWPNVVQFIVFTVYQDTGSTVRYAWQGFSGTFMAAVNMVIISGTLREDWRERHSEKVIQMWALVVIFLFLFSRTDVNTKRWGLSWHIWFMMNFLNPKSGEDYYKVVCGTFCDDDTGVVVVTTILGAIISIVATLVPPLLSTRKAKKDITDITQEIGQIWTDSLKYFLGQEDPGTLPRVQKRIERLEVKQSQVKENIEASWWESFGLFGAGKVLSLRRDCFSALTDVRHIMYGLSRDLRKARFHAERDVFVKEMGKELEVLQVAANELMNCCVDSCLDGYIDEEERENICRGIRSVSVAQKSLTRKYRDWSQYNVSEPNVFAFFLSYWARRISDYAKKVLKKQPRRQDLRWQWRGSEASRFCSNVNMCCRKLGLNFIDGEHEFEHPKWAGRNFIPIAITFMMAANIETPFLSKYDNTMPNTLALLIDPSVKVEAEKDAHRFLAVALGSLLPVMMLSLWESLECTGWGRFWAQFLGIFIFITTFVYIYYSSRQWSYLGCLIAGFGVYPLLSFCERVMLQSFTDRYAELGQVCLALTIQICVAQLPLLRRRADHKLVRYVKALHAELKCGFQAYFNGDLGEVEEHEHKMEKHLTMAMAMAPQCHPNLEIAPFWDAPFKFELTDTALKQLQVIVGAFHMLKIAMGGTQIADNQSEGSGVSDGNGEDSSDSCSRASADSRVCNPQELLHLFGDHGLKFREFREDFVELLESVMSALPEFMLHRSETRVEEATVEQLRHLRDEEERLSIESPSADVLRSSLLELKLDQRDEEMRDLTGELRARAAVVIKAIADAYHRLHRIREALLKEDIY